LDFDGEGSGLVTIGGNVFSNSIVSSSISPSSKLIPFPLLLINLNLRSPYWPLLVIPPFWNIERS
jgi:hypothetical protein